MMKKTLSILLVILVAVKWSRSVRVFAPGNIIIGGLFTIHEEVTQPADFSQLLTANCTKLSPSGLANSLAMIHAVEAANNSPLLKNLGVTLGYHIQDTCSDVTKALIAVEEFTKSCTSVMNTSNYIQPVSIVIGAYESEVSISVARELNLHLIPQVSYSSTAKILSDKNSFPGFSRTVPNDVHQTKAIVKLLHEKNWTWVGILTTDGEYGRAALDSFVSEASSSGICVAFQEILPDCLSDKPKLQAAISRTNNTIVTNGKVKVVVSFAKTEHMRIIFRKLVECNADQKIWIASDSWSMSQDVLKPDDLEKVGWVVGFSFISKNIDHFKAYLTSLESNDEAQQNNSFLKKFYSSTANATSVMIKNVYADLVFSINMAINAVTQATAQLCKNRNCTIPEAVKPHELLPALRKGSYQLQGISYAFDDNGDVNLGYFISIWKKCKDGIETLNEESQYHPTNSTLNVTKLTLNLVSRCSNVCQPGQFKKTAEGVHTCCYECTECAENQFTNTTDMDLCYSCDTNTEWAERNSSKCKKKTVEYFCWSEPFAKVLVCFATLGVIMVMAISFLFFIYRQSPVVLASGGWLCQLVLVSLSGSFSSTVLFVGDPTDDQCKARQVLYGLSFTLCVSCILVKTLKILLAFQISLPRKELLQRLYKPYAIVGACVALQVATCTCWLVLKSPHKTLTPSSKTILKECDEGSYVAFGVMLGYIAMLALICFVLAFIGRKLPEKYNEAKFITFGMLLYLIAWIIFIPTYVSTKGKYLPAVEIIVILISSYGILCCHFLPKCYIIIFKKAQNTRDAFFRSIYEYSKKTFGNLGSTRSKQDQAIPTGGVTNSTSEP